MDKYFEQYIKEARDSFVKKTNQQQWNTELRTNAEDLLIAYDQMAEQLREQSRVNHWKIVLNVLTAFEFTLRIVLETVAVGILFSLLKYI